MINVMFNVMFLMIRSTHFTHGGPTRRGHVRQLNKSFAFIVCNNFFIPDEQVKGTNKMANIYADIDECIQSLTYYYDIQVD